MADDLPPMEIADTISVSLDPEGMRLLAQFPSWCQMATATAWDADTNMMAVCEAVVFPGRVPMSESWDGTEHAERLAVRLRDLSADGPGGRHESAELLLRVAAYLEGVVAAIRIVEQRGLL